MIAIFNNAESAIEYSDKVHAFLQKNCKGYNAEKWQDINKADKAELYSVKVPRELSSTKVLYTIDKVVDSVITKVDVRVEFDKVVEKISVIEKVVKLPIDWKPIEIEIKPIDEKIITIRK